MLVYAAAFLLLTNSVPAEPQVAVSCAVVGERAKKYLDDHDLDARGLAKADGSFDISLFAHKDASLPSGKPLKLDRHSISKYTLPKHLSLFKTYDNFRSEGRLTLTKLTDSSCKLNLRFKFSAYEYVWALAAIDDGYATKFVSNGVLEDIYLDAITNLFSLATR